MTQDKIFDLSKNNFGHFIGGKFTNPKNTFKTLNPATGKLLARLSNATEEDVKKEFFDFEEEFTFNASELGTGNHKISAEAFASWETHPYIKKGDAKNQSDEIEISIN
mgnify:CR=1 FL=1